MLFMSQERCLGEGAKYNVDKAHHGTCIVELSEAFQQESLRAVTYRPPYTNMGSI
jgi:hypothetical protein